MQPLDLALQYATDGWKVFPCRSVAEEHIDQHTGEVITFGEKTPLTPNGFKGATKFPHILKRWWSDWPTAAIGLPTGGNTGFFALDIDNKPGGANGFEWLAEMEAEHGQLPQTARVTSPNGGLHIYFKYVVGTRNRGALGAGVDIRSEGGYVLAAGSVMHDGRSYKWVDDTREIADAPPWLLDLLLPKSAPAHTGYTASVNTNSAYVDAAVDQELRDLSAVPMGNRNNALNDASFSLGTFVGAGALAESEARAMLQDVARGWGRDWTRCCKTIENGLKAGIQNPRHIPEAQQDNTRLVDISRMIKRGLEKAHTGSTQYPEYQAAVDAEAYISEESPAGDDQPIAEADNDNEPPESPIVATAFKWIDPTTLPRREFAYGTHLIRKFVSVTVAPGGIGKTNLSIGESLAMASGRDLLGTKPPQRLKVWLFNSEDPRDELDRRIMATCLHYKLTSEDVEGHLFVDTGREQELVVAIEDKKTGLKYQEPIIEAVVSQIERHGIDVMIVDPFVSTHSVNENDNGAIDKVAKLWAQIADHTNCAIDIVHHLRKVADREATVEDARGAVSLIGAARSVRVLNRMSEEQASEAGVPAAERTGYFSVNYGKSNLTPMSSKMDWRRLVSVPLGNGQGLQRPQDHAPAVVSWAWPSAEALIDGITEEQREMIRAAVSSSDYKASQKAKNWVGQAVAYAVGLDLEDEASRKRAASIAKALLKEGVLVEIEGRDPIRRETAMFVRAA
ncbi:bifunctional DNA primase/polymerase [Rhizobium sp. RCAM05973]|uniref:bifunctional DNA primase/polymerase n=1 Tax=Rhizobium sp. RCAM05973 TaxID=2994066 RepID=UPI0022EBD7F0|nr:bifunctional DNA primase/polymerase [Rhizobium sp. RCAM05973]